MPKRANQQAIAVKELAARMLLVLESQRRLGGTAYPPTWQRLAELCELRASDDCVKAAANTRSFTERAIVIFKEKRKPARDALVILKETLDDEDEAASLMPALLVPLLEKFRTPANQALSLAELKKKLPAKLQKPFQEGIKRGMEWQTLPPEVAWVTIKGSPRLFLRDDLPPARPRPAAREAEAEATPSANGHSGRPAVATRDFARAFREAFEQLDRRNGATNFVKLADLRRVLADFDREQFDAGLDRLRREGAFALDSHEGLYGTLTPEEREAGIREAGSLLVYVSRRS
ncbi:MAG: hypothetical protein IRY99_11920 [Isosphaeraceae bacterium]|nr:hypothetical protein [Isosphaeraceae bacterium]